MAKRIHWKITGDIESWEGKVGHTHHSQTIETTDGTPVLLPWDTEAYNAGFYIKPKDARLIIAAPDLLRSLKAMVRIFRIPDHVDAEKYARVWNEAVEVIKKAEKGE